MKKIVTACILLLCFGGHGIGGEGKIDGRKRDDCLLDSNKCHQAGGYALLEKIERLKAATEQGTAVYSPQELELLKKKLKEAEEANDLIQG